MIVLGLDSAPSRTGWALVERDGGRERLIGHGHLDAVDGELVQEFAGRMANRVPQVDAVLIEDCYLDKNVDVVKKLSRLVGRWQQAFEMMGMATDLVMASVWQRQILSGLIMNGTEREGRKKAAALWVRSTFGEALEADEADAAGIATFEARRRAFAERIEG